jgi:plasmid stabilization system protein ParE
MRVVWSKLAEKRMDDVFEWYERKNKSVAIKIYNEILDSVEILKTFPYIAAIEPLLVDCAKTYRSLVVKCLFKIVYRIENEDIYIVTVWNCRQKPNNLRGEIGE